MAGFLTLLLAFLLALPTNSVAAKGGIPGPPTGGEASNNLSMPAVQTESVNSILANWSTPTEPVLGVHYSYGCDKGESDGSFSYPNTSCVDSLSDPTIYYDALECTDNEMPSPCEGLPVERIYWQKVDVNEWWADDDGISSDPGYVAYVDWGDALEAVSWNERSVIRVETQPYSTQIPGFNPVMNCYDAAIAASLDPETACKVGFQMWHVSGQGITEHWGVRANDDVGELTPATSYNYDSPFQIIKTNNARLNLTKLEAGTATCSMPGDNPGDPSPLGEEGVWTGTEWQGTCTYSDEPYSVEVSVGGKYVYGFNWRMKNVELDSLCAGWEKTGFWRLTFYAPEEVMFTDPDAPNVAPPAVPSEVRTLPRTEFNTVTVPAPEPVVAIFAEEEEEDPTADDRLYRPVVDTVNNLTYLDICIVGKTKGGGGGKPGGGGGGDGKPGGGGNKVNGHPNQ
ncbi:hypothetical protein [Malonomonas rubra]|uniref:hypothetical protein n=1 Tax=Malonomonas rubra TaxID=57040 RepID=UPI0026EB2681|nr:hypothetical protein [Malonomonas rubra]